MKRVLVLVSAGILLFLGIAFAEEPRSSVSINFTGVVNKDTSTSLRDQVATSSGGLLTTYRLNVGKHHGIDFNYGYSRNSQYFAGRSAEVGSAIHESTAAYVYRLPFRKLTPFATVGAGALVFNPTSSPKNFAGADTQVRTAFLYGGGLDYNVSKLIGVRAQYRGLIYKAPDFGVSGVGTALSTHTAEPSIGLVLRF